MKRAITIAIILGAFIGAGAGFSFADEFRVTKVYDGDTVRAETSELVIYISLLGIDAPEVSCVPERQAQPFAKEATDLLRRLVLNKIVVVKGYGTLPYPDKDIIGVLYRGDKNINLEMVKQGFAEVQRRRLPRGFNVTPYLKAEKEAKEKGRGMWSLGDAYISPWEWRRRHGGY